ncbi:hypothetical protein, conserved [Trypanosoma brucei gambiense DAL972]|uniref:Calponin-homology (CH) domain-containing protein n=2 Tax=Trypanosoma brucei TaxID=5691 RepID=C9ZXA4_TRYB9|nr:hypothetical protein, conserved [Trypanosoma brucei gambiense DAL972]RHW70676.1 EB1-like C-terminal motif containing protein [Trypanosoma brucei equiperdum]CBH14048.1 hypothetical protein, conserved [Trypanosoma brucei gambiense DAL972]|eukprot:XP_011776319.1 hypothetical protein, conserved [Trypanosoma brucei gambiense DAL972]
MDHRNTHGLVNIVPSRGTRTELLAWLNDLMPHVTASGYEVPRLCKVEHCGNGVPYVLLLPQMLPFVHPALIARAKVPARHDFEAVSNLKLMADALQKNGIPPPEVLVDDVDKLIKGAFQANLQLLQWFRGLGDVLMPQHGREEYRGETGYQRQPRYRHCDASEDASLISEQSQHSTSVGTNDDKPAASRAVLPSRGDAPGLKRGSPRTTSVCCSGKLTPSTEPPVIQGPAAVSTSTLHTAPVDGIKKSPISRRTSTPVDRSRVTTPAGARRLLDTNSTGPRGATQQSPTMRGRSNPRHSLPGKEGSGFRPRTAFAGEAAAAVGDKQTPPLSTSESTTDDKDMTPMGEATTTKSGAVGPNIVRRGRDQPMIPPKTNNAGSSSGVLSGSGDISERTCRPGGTTPVRTAVRSRNSLSGVVNPSNVRERCAVDPHASVEMIVSPLMSKNASGKLLQSVSAATPSMSAGMSRSGSRGESSSEGDSAVAAAALLKATRERQFYYDKLRQVEAIVLPLVDESSTDRTTRTLVTALLDVLYAAE